jgi:lipopolysaccharide transport system permease protein
MEISSAPLTPTTIRPSGGRAALNLTELINYRDLIFFFVWRDIKVRYRQTVLGASWAVIQPLLTMTMMAVVFGRLAGVPSDGAPYPVFCFAGLVLWSFFAQAVTNASASVVNNAQLVEKVYFPRLSITIAASLASLLDFLLNLTMLLLLMAAYGYHPRLESLLCAPIAIAVLALAAGIGSGLAALTVRFRDVRHLVPFLTQIWLLGTPVIYPLALLPERWQTLAGINPLSGYIEIFRWALLGTGGDPWATFLVSLLSTAVLIPSGLLLFKRMEHSFADVI